jgi:type VI secretion system protein ImpG
MFNKYYQSELSYLRELGREFSETHPELADVFAAKGGDPDVERLLEGFAFLTARIRGRIDDAVPELIEALAQLAFPHYVRSLPSAAIIEMTPSANALRARHMIPAGSELGSRPVEGTSCTFRTTMPFELLPLSIEGVAIDPSSSRTTVLRVSFRVPDAGRGAVFSAPSFRLHFAGPFPQASTLFLWFTKHLRSIVYRAGGTERALGDGSVRAPAIDAGGGLLPWPKLSHPGPRLLQEYFLLPESLLFADVHGLERVPPECAAEHFDLLFHFEGAPGLPERVAAEQVRVNCVPAINLFDVAADPIALDPRAYEHLLRASTVNPRHMEIYEIHDVTGVRDNRRERVRYSRFVSFEHSGKAREEQTYFTVRRAVSPIDEGLDTYLAVMTPRDVPIATEPETLSISLTCTNRMLPASLRVGDISVPIARSPTVARFRNITGATPPIPPPLGSELYWRLLAHLALNQRSLGEGDNLRALVNLYCFEGDQQQARANRARVAAIQGARMSLGRRVADNLVLRGVRVDVALDETQLAGVGDANLLGHAIDALFGALAPINSFSALHVKLNPSLSELSWPARNGIKSPF